MQPSLLLKTNTDKKLYGLDHLRALAIAFVFLYHYYVFNDDQPGWLSAVAEFGWTGVDLFFVLSGFLISSQLFEQLYQQQKISFPSFFIKRFLRIVPAFAITVAVYFCLPFFREKEALPPLWKFVTFTQNFGLNPKLSGTFSHAWSLCVEEHFYLLLPLILIILQRTNSLLKSYWLLPFLFLLGFVLRWYSFHELFLPKANLEYAGAYWYEYVYYPTYNRLDGLIAGVSIAAVNKFMPELWKKISSYGNLLLISGLIVLTVAYFICKDQLSFYASVFGFPLVSLGYGLLVAGAVSNSSFLFKWKSNTTTFIAAVSYSLYLTHKGVVHITHSLFAGIINNSNLMFLLCIATSTLVAYLLYKTVEKPFMNLRNKMLKMETS